MDKRTERTIAALQKNNFETYFVRDTDQARTLFFEQILPRTAPATVSWGDSETMKATGILDELARRPEIALIRTFAEGMSLRQKIHWRRQALLSDLFLTGSNAITQKGQLVNLDMIGNRIGGITFGPEHVVLFVGTNKIVPDIEAAVERIRTIAAPRNAMRHTDIDTPCRRTGRCVDCRSPQRICNSWSVIEKSYPKGRIRIVLIDRELGL